MTATSGTDEVDLLIVGAGPSGLYGGYYAGFRGMSVALVDTLEEPGGQVAAMYPEKKIFDIAGFPEVLGRDLVERLVDQVQPFGPAWLLGRKAETLEPAGSGWKLGLSDGSQVRARAVLITAGIGGFTPRSFPAGTGHEGKGLFYFVRDPGEFTGRDVVIIGGGDSAFDWALTLEPIARSVTLVHRRDTFRAHEHSVNVVRAGSTRVITSSEVVRCHGEDCITAVDVTTGGETTERLPADAVIAALGFQAKMGPLLDWGLEMTSRHIAVDTAMQTNLPGVFAAGDITDYPGKVRLISVGFGEAATAVNNAAALIDPTQSVFPGHSTDNSIPDLVGS